MLFRLCSLGPACLKVLESILCSLCGWKLKVERFLRGTIGLWVNMLLLLLVLWSVLGWLIIIESDGQLGEWEEFLSFQLSVRHADLSDLSLSLFSPFYVRFFSRPYMSIVMIFVSILLLIWTIPFGLKFFAFAFSGVSYSGQGVFFAWANVVCNDDEQERAVVSIFEVPPQPLCLEAEALSSQSTTISWFSSPGSSQYESLEQRHQRLVVYHSVSCHWYSEVPWVELRKIFHFDREDVEELRRTDAFLPHFPRLFDTEKGFIAMICVAILTTVITLVTRHLDNRERALKAAEATSEGQQTRVGEGEGERVTSGSPSVDSEKRMAS